MATFRKPSEIRTEQDAAIEAARPHLKTVERLKKEKARQVDHYGMLISRVRQSEQLTELQFVDWRNEVYRLSEDDRAAAIDSKVRSLKVAPVSPQVPA